ncbi:MAG: alanine racemase [Salibacteraceae bacterium]|nr:alanine racemase [Salibacteraceae bacterium]MDP4686552.1 alanine racemase [Salibacteraceae bacterium]MDP4764653.1 alanine racemase [Salibacteraceae bacterium]
MFETSIIEINKSALDANLKFIRKQIGNRKLSCVVKGNAYGHGMEEYVPIAEQLGVNHFAVYSADEAERIHSIKHPKTEIMIMGSVDDAALAWAIENGIECWMFELDRLEKAIELAVNLDKKALIHIELETGMNRTGFKAKNLDKAAELILKNSNRVEIVGICTHFAGAESISNYYRIKDQIEVYNQLVAHLNELNIRAKYYHTCCSAASLRFPEMMLDMVRIGILQFGFWPSQETFIEFTRNQNTKTDPLKRLITWKSAVMSIKEVNSGDYIGYGTSFLAQRDMTIGICPVGYSHGFSRSLGNQGRAVVNGTRVSVIGTVNMNCIALDLSEVSAEKGDEVLLIGSDGKAEITVASFSEFSNQLNYELLTRLPLNIPRIVTHN